MDKDYLEAIFPFICGTVGIFFIIALSMSKWFQNWIYTSYEDEE